MERKSVRTSKEIKPGQGSEGGGAPESAMSLPEFLAEAELSHYHNALRNELKVTCVEHLKYVKEEDLECIGMTRPEMRRLKKFYKKEHPQGTFGKLKRAIMRSGGGGGGEPSGRSLSPSPPEHRISRPVSTVVRPPGKQLIAVDAISLHKALGEGEFGVVQQGVWTTENGEKVQVAVKCLSKEKMQNGQAEFLKEAAIMQSVDHENIVRMYGVVLDKENTFMLVTELAPMRSLLECLKEPSLRPDFPVPRLCDFAQQVCDGMSYLESKRLIHRDLAARNILVFSKNKVKISDLGLSRALGVGKDYYQSQYSASLKLPIAWCAPECINYLKFTSASDIWSYGVTLWEFFTYGFQPWAGLNGQQILDAVDQPQSQRLEPPDLCPKEYYALLQKCWEHDPDRRPTFSQLFLTLPQVRPIQLKAVKDYPSFTVEKDHLYYRNYDIIIVLDKNPSNPPSPGMWKGCLVNGKYGFFQPTHTVPFVEPKTSPISLPKASLTRKESGRSSKRSKLRTEMIGAPEGDLRHTGHIGYDGAVFGDVSFIGDNYDKLPVKVGAAGKMDLSRGSSLSSIPTDGPDRNGFVKSSNSEDSLDRHRNGYGHSWISQESLSSTRTDEPDGYLDIEDNSIFADFKMPDLAGSFDFGPSFMDEVLKALDEKEKQAEAARSPSFNGRDFGDDIDPNRVDLDDKSPMLDEDEKTPMLEEKGFSMYGEKGGSPVKQSGPPPLPSQPPRLDSQREKKQAKVKPMSASEEKMMEDAITLANEVTATRAQRHSQSQSPPRSPTGSGKISLEYGEHSLEHPAAPSLISKLKNSIRRSPKTERKRTFSDDRPQKGDVEEELPPGAQEAYNALVVRGSDRQRDEAEEAERVSVSSDAVFTLDSTEPAPRHAEPAVMAASSAALPAFPSSRQSSSRGSGLPQPPPRPMPKPRMEPKKSDMPVPKPRPEIVQRVEPTIRRPPDSPEVHVKEKETHHPVPASRKESVSETKEREREQLKRTIEIVRMESPAHDEAPTQLQPAPESDTKESTPEPDSDSTLRSSASEGVTDSSASKVLSMFEEDFSEPSPREIMSKLARDSRMRRNLDHQRALSGENQDMQAPAVTRISNKREPQGIPGKATLAQSEDLEKDEEEVDTNPLRMLRGGAIPIRTSRGAGNSPAVKGSASALRYKFGFQRGGSESNTAAANGEDAANGGGGGGGIGSGPKLPPRSQSINNDCEGEVVPPPPRRVGEREAPPPVPSLPPRTPLRQHSLPALNSRPRERRNPLVYSKDSGCDAAAPPSSSSSLSVSNCNTSKTSSNPSSLHSFSANKLSASFDASSSSFCPPPPSSSSSSCPAPPPPAYGRSVSLHDEPCPADLPQAPSRPQPHCRPSPLTLPLSSAQLPSVDVSTRSDLDSHHYYGVDESALDSSSDDVFLSSSRRALPPPPPPPPPPSHTPAYWQCVAGAGMGGSSSGGGAAAKKFAPNSVKCSLEQLGFYNRHDPFWVQTVRLPERTRSDTTHSSEEVSPLLLVNYKNSDNVSYEDLLDFGLDRQKNGEEVETLHMILDNEVSYEECRTALEETGWDMGQAVKYVRLKQLLSLHLADVHACKRALMAHSWQVHAAADHLLTLQRQSGNGDSSPECLEV